MGSTYINDIVTRAAGLETFFKNPSLTQEGFREIPWKAEFAEEPKSLLDIAASVIGLESFQGIDRLDRETAVIEPHCSVLIKKKMFETTSDAWLLKGDKARLELLAVKTLMLQKINQFALYEGISKFKTFQSFATGIRNKYGRAAAEAGEALLYESTISEVAGLIRSLKSRVIQKTRAIFYPNTVGEENEFKRILGFSGVIELGNFSDVSTQISIKDGGACSITLENPYHWMFITGKDIVNAVDYILGIGKTSNNGLEITLSETEKITLKPDDVETIRIDIIRRMFKNFAGHTIIQPVDTIYVFMGRAGDPGDVDLVYSQLKALQKKSSDETDSAKKEKLQKKANELLKEIERSQQFYDTLEKPAFTGVIRKVEDSQADGFYKVKVHAEDVKYWLSAARTNTQPSLDQPKGALEYPLITYVVEKSIGGIKKTPLEKATSEQIKNALKSPADQNMFQSDWKEGVHTAVTKLIHGDKVLKENPSDETSADIRSVNDTQINFGLNLYSEVLAGADVADAISLLITGIPYRKETYAKAALGAAGGEIVVGNDPEASKEPALPRLGYFASVQLNARIQATKLGNFEPYGLSDFNVNEIEKYTKEADLNRFKEEITEVSDEIEKLKNQQTRASSARLKTNLGKKIHSLEIYKTKLENIANKKPETSENTLAPSLIKNSAKPVEKYPLTINRGMIVTHQNKNYFVVSEEYKAIRYLQAFVQRIAGINGDIWNSEYNDIRTICEEIANIIDFEFFADASGNLIFRPPQYNRTPKFVFLLPETIDRMDDRFKEKIREYIKANESYGSSASTPTLIKEKLLSELKAQETDRAPIGKLLYERTAEILEKTLKQFKKDSANIVEKLPPNILQRVDMKQTVDPFDLDKFTGHGEYTHFLKDRDIISWDISQNEPDFTRVDIFGKMDLIDESAWPGGAMSFWAGAVDYDLWRMYGYKPQSYTKAFFNKFDSAVTQCRPYAYLLMGRQKHKILKGSITVTPYEGYELGHVVFIEPLNMLYYIESVSQNFVWGGQWTTTLSISYGRYPGQFIPYPFDLIGSLVEAENAHIKTADILPSNVTGSPLENRTFTIYFKRYTDKRPSEFLQLDDKGEYDFNIVKSYVEDLRDNAGVSRATITLQGVYVVDNPSDVIEAKAVAKLRSDKLYLEFAKTLGVMSEKIIFKKDDPKEDNSFVYPHAVLIKTEIIEAKEKT